MKLLVVFGVVLVLAVTLAQAEEFSADNCKEEALAPFKGQCVRVKCNKENTQLNALGCAESQCPGEVLEVKEDRTKPYPQCCPQLICK